MTHSPEHTPAAPADIDCDQSTARQWNVDGAVADLMHEGLDATLLARRLVTDGPPDGQWFDGATVHLLEREVWGQAFEAPTFCDGVEVVGD